MYQARVTQLLEVWQQYILHIVLSIGELSTITSTHAHHIAFLQRWHTISISRIDTYLSGIAEIVVHRRTDEYVTLIAYILRLIAGRDTLGSGNGLNSGISHSHLFVNLDSHFQLVLHFYFGIFSYQSTHACRTGCNGSFATHACLDARLIGIFYSSTTHLGGREGLSFLDISI